MNYSYLIIGILALNTCVYVAWRIRILHSLLYKHFLSIPNKSNSLIVKRFVEYRLRFYIVSIVKFIQSSGHMAFWY